MSKNTSEPTNKVENKHLDVTIDTNQKNNLKKDCLSCRVTGTLGLFGIAVYMFAQGRKHTKPVNKIIINSLASGIFFVGFRQEKIPKYSPFFLFKSIIKFQFYY